MRIIGVGPCRDDFCGGLSGHGVDEEILDGGEEDLRSRVSPVVVAAECEEVPHLLVEALFGGPDVPDALQHLVEVIWAAVGVLHALIIHHEAFDEVFL